MENRKKLLLAALALVLLLGGAYALYGRLGSEMTADRLAVRETEPSAETASSPDTAASTDTDSSAEAAASSGTQEDTREDAGAQAPDFTVYDIDGNAVRLSDYEGKPVVLNFWASWCGPCQTEMPDFQEKYQELGEDVRFLMINMTDGSRETVETASDFVAQQGYSFPVFYDTESEAAMTYGVYSLPTTYFIDASGAAVARASGAIDAETLQRGIDMIAK
ncbi:MAG: TlpA disulfide reductase family protein [Eubacteriales bacterium]|nr:TlpA disulfide reductase family protein [Eubacteriales bacterium]